MATLGGAISKDESLGGNTPPCFPIISSARNQVGQLRRQVHSMRHACPASAEYILPRAAVLRITDPDRVPRNLFYPSLDSRRIEERFEA